MTELRLEAVAHTHPYALQPQPWWRNERYNWPTTDTAVALDPYRHAPQRVDRP